MSAGYFPPDTHWRDSARSARFFFIDARAALPVFIFLMHIRVWTAVVAGISMVFFGILERFGFTMPIFWLWIRSFLGGSRKMSIPWWKV